MEQRIRIMKEESLKRVDMLVMNANGPKITYQTFVDMLNNKETDIKIENVYDINPGEKDFRMIISKIVENNPDIVIAEMQTPEMDVFIRQLRDKSNIKLSGLMPFLVDKNLAEGAWFVDGANPSDFYFNSFKRLTGRDTTNYSEYFYTALQIIINTYENSEKPSPQTFIDLSNNIDTVLGKVSFDKDGILNSDATVKRIKNGQVVLDK
jgi:ABC-type branched-subunit amino acid transport system substrate-binding protein